MKSSNKTQRNKIRNIRYGVLEGEYEQWELLNPH